ncbi:type II toxin-antitoxin system prevent-host-death family antitoxin [Nesterenkonia aurantiaca]|nr:type II toxin-antitoxin system prevent-host-death family antitoxin [Nesterenkonia aurantiaca]
MTSTTLSDFRAHQSKILDDAQREPVEILSRGSRRRAVVVSPEFFDRAIQALEDQTDTHGAAEARSENGSVSHQELMAELDL